MQGFDFAFPVGAYGNSSGWAHRRGVDLHRQPDLAARRLVSLTRVGRAVLIPADQPASIEAGGARVVSFLQKQPAADGRHGQLALSSGAGSALFKTADGRTFKLKRCGLGTCGFPGDAYRCHSALKRGTEYHEFTGTATAGLMSVEAALAEAAVAHALNACGLLTAMTPAAILLIDGTTDTPADDDAPLAGAVLMEITSDLRIDELVYMAMTPLLSRLFTAGTLSYDDTYRHWGFFDADALPVIATRREWAHIGERLHAVGVSVGSAYRRYHDAGLLRGLGSCWFGNEVVGPDGNVSLVDFDGGAANAGEYPPELAHAIKRLEIDQYRGASLEMLTGMRPLALQLFGGDFAEGVCSGYGQAYTRVPADLIAAIVGDHAATRDAVWQGLGFSDDPDIPTAIPADLAVPTLDALFVG